MWFLKEKKQIKNYVYNGIETILVFYFSKLWLKIIKKCFIFLF